MKILVSFQPNKKASDFEGVRLRKTIKGALEMVGVTYTVSDLDQFDVAHLISPEEESKVASLIDRKIPIIVSACYCEDDTNASYLEYKSKDGVRTVNISSKALRFLNKVDLILVPSEIARNLLVDSGVTTPISIALPGINLSRFNFSRDDEKDIFFRYFRENRNKKIVVGLGEYDANMDGINAFINAAKKCPDAVFYYFGKESTPGILKTSKVAKNIKGAPSNVKFVNLVPDDVYRSALMNASVFMLPSYKPAGVVSVIEAMGAKCQIVARKQAVYSDIVKDGVNGYVAEYSETLSSLTRDYLDNKLKPTIDEAYSFASKCNLTAVGEQLMFFYQQEINKKNI